jgi:hypothetical protein
MSYQMMRISSAMLAVLACVHLTAAAADQPLGTAAQNAIYELAGKIATVAVLFKPPH